MFKALKGNRVIRIDETRADEYIKMGYKVTTMDGKLIGKPVTLADIKDENSALKAEIEKLKKAPKSDDGAKKELEATKKELEELKKENATLKAKVTKLEKAQK